VLTVLAPLLVDEGIDPAAVTCEIAREAGPDGARLSLRIRLPVEADTSVRHALAVRALSAVRAVRGARPPAGIDVSCPGATRSRS
jgi:hypothetical protein